MDLFERPDGKCVGASLTPLGTLLLSHQVEKNQTQHVCIKRTTPDHDSFNLSL